AGGMSGPIPRSGEAVPCAMRRVMGLRIAIVGGGSAGSVLANRLSAHADFEIWLLEAGRTYSPERFPKALADGDNLGGGTEFDWGYMGKTTGLGCTIAAQSGKVLGVSPAINAAVAKRARGTDFARWKAQGVGGRAFHQLAEPYKYPEITPDGA